MKKTAAHENRTALLFLAPSLAGFSIFFLIPFAGGFYYSLVDSPINGRFTGLNNYIGLLSNAVFLKAALNTAVFTGICVPLNILLSLSLALALNRKIYGRSILRTAFIIPLVIPVASVVLIWQFMFDFRGSVNGILLHLGMGGVDWMKSEWARGVVMLMYLWKNIGYNMVLFLAGLQSIPAEYYESADVDGAGAWRKFRSITLIYLMPTAFFVFIMSIINSFKVFRETYLLAGAYPQEDIYILQHYMNNMFLSLDYQKLTTAAFIIAVFIFVLIFLFFRAERKISESIS